MSNQYLKEESKSQTLRSVVTTESGPPITQQITTTWVDFLAGYRNPSHKWQIVRVQDATTPMTAEKQWYELSDGELGGGYQLDDKPFNPIWYRERVHRGHITWPGLPSDPASLNFNEANEKALAAIWKQAIKKRKAIQGGVFLGELAQTLQMVRSRGMSCMSLLTRWNDRLRKSKRYTRRLQDKKKEAADAWLEFGFGWAPLAADISDGLKVWYEPRREAKRIRAGGETKVVTNSVGGLGSIGPILAREYVTNVTHASVRYVACIGAEVPGVRGLADRLGLLPADFVPSVYELLPWSFLVDYFVNIGDIVGALSYPSALLEWQNRTVRLDSSIRSMYSYAGDAGFPKHRVMFTRQTPSIVTRHRTRIMRAKLVSLPYPSLHFNVPGSVKKWLNMGALIAARAFKYYP